MLPHEKHLMRALKECGIIKLVQDLGMLYVTAHTVDNPDIQLPTDFETSLKVCKVLDKAAKEIADIKGAKLDKEVAEYFQNQQRDMDVINDR